MKRQVLLKIASIIFVVESILVLKYADLGVDIGRVIMEYLIYMNMVVACFVLAFSMKKTVSNIFLFSSLSYLIFFGLYYVMES